MLKRKGLIVIILVIIFAGCKKDEPLIPGPFTELDLHTFGYDYSNRIIMYNGDSTAINDGELRIGDDVFSIETTDSELSTGKAYPATFRGEEFRMFYTELPIIAITTNGTAIVDEPKIPGKIYLLEKNKTVLSNNIGIELRGGFTLSFPKKSYSVELWEDNSGNETEKIPLLGMRNDDDWILDGMWNEPIRIRDFTAHSLWLEMGRVQQQNIDMKLGIDKEYCELFVNGQYRGIFYLGEKIDRKQLDLEKYTDQIEGELYKGDEWADGVTFRGVDDFDNGSDMWSGYECKYPEKIGEIDWSNLHGLVDFVVNSTQSEFDEEISSKIDLDNAIDYYIFLNLIYAQDNIGKNIYTAKYNSSSLYFFVPWDMDGSFGNNWEGLRIDESDKMLSNGLFDKLLSFPEFKNKVKLRWTELRIGTLQTSHLKNQFRGNYEYLKSHGMYDREAIVPDLERNYSDSEIDFIESWIERRVNFLDVYFNSL